MRNAAICFFFCFAILFSNAQPALVSEINRVNPPAQALAPLRFLASDELMGRATTRPEIHIATRYISEQFRSFALMEVPGTKDYIQSFALKFISPSMNGSLVVGKKTYYMGADLLQVRGTGVQFTAPVVFAGFGASADLAGIDVKGKIVVVNMGESDSTTVREANRFREAKQKLLKEKGALALVERYWQPDSEWELPKHAYSSQRAFASPDSLLPVFIIHDPAGGLIVAVKSATTCTINSTGSNLIEVPAKNVMGWVEGTDPLLRNQFIVLSAHYDHIGVASVPKMEEGKSDSIYNGARDNAVGVTAVINAARFFALHPAKRSILFIAFTGEEMGLLAVSILHHTQPSLWKKLSSI